MPSPVPEVSPVVCTQLGMAQGRNNTVMIFGLLLVSPCGRYSYQIQSASVVAGGADQGVVLLKLDRVNGTRTCVHWDALDGFGPWQHSCCLRWRVWCVCHGGCLTCCMAVHQPTVPLLPSLPRNLRSPHPGAVVAWTHSFL